MKDWMLEARDFLEQDCVGYGYAGPMLQKLQRENAPQDLIDGYENLIDRLARLHNESNNLKHGSNGSVGHMEEKGR